MAINSVKQLGKLNVEVSEQNRIEQYFKQHEIKIV